MSSTERPPNRLLQALPDADFTALQPRLKPFEMVRDAVLAEAGTTLTQVYLPHKGAISITVGLSEGQSVQVAMSGRDSMVGALEVLSDGVSLSDAIVLFPGAASVFDIADFRTVADQSTTLRRLIVRRQQALLAEVEQSCACNASHSVEARLSRWLLRAHDLCDEAELPMTQELLARMIGVQRNAISIVAHALQRAGVISYSRGHIEVTKMAALRQASCECYQAVKARHERLLGRT